MSDINEKYIVLLTRQIEKLDADDFDLEAWKSASTILITRIFGENSTKVKEVEKIKFDLSSWALRDASGSYDQLKSCKKRGKVILEACIDEISILGIDEESNTEINADPLVFAIEQELKITQYKEILKILKTKSSIDEKKKMIINKLQSFGVEVSPMIVANILTDPSLKKKFK